MDRLKVDTSGLTLERKIELLKAFYAGWCSLPDRPHHWTEKETCESLLSDLVGMEVGEYFEDDEDVRKRVTGWLVEKEKYLKEKFVRRLNEACLSRHKK